MCIMSLCLCVPQWWYSNRQFISEMAVYVVVDTNYSARMKFKFSKNTNYSAAVVMRMEDLACILHTEASKVT
jgi:isoprenylcysteine carboxyl methyltransferase (ICMT) family protein YpbQ